MAERPAQQRSNGNIWQWIIGLIVLLLVIWIISGLFGNGADDEPIMPPDDEEQVPQEEPPQQEPQQNPQSEEQQSHERAITWNMPEALALLEVTAEPNWPDHLLRPYPSS